MLILFVLSTNQQTERELFLKNKTIFQATEKLSLPVKMAHFSAHIYSPENMETQRKKLKYSLIIPARPEVPFRGYFHGRRLPQIGGGAIQEGERGCYILHF